MADEENNQYTSGLPSNQETSSNKDFTALSEAASDREEKATSYHFYGDFNTSHSHNIAGDFVGRDSRIFNIGSLPIDPLKPTADEHVDLIIKQIQRLRGKITRIIPTQERILVLQYLHNVSIIQNSLPINAEMVLGVRNSSLITEKKEANRSLSKSIKDALGFLFPSFYWLIELATFNLTDLTSNVVRKIFKALELFTEETSTQVKGIAEEHLDELYRMESSLSTEMDSSEKFELLRRLSRIIDKVNIQISRLDADFKSIIHSSRSSRSLIDNMASKINHSEYQNEAKMHLSIVSGLASRLEENDGLLDSTDVLSDDVWSAIGVMTEIEQRRITVERLISLDRGAKRFTVLSVTVYLTILILILSLIYVFSNVPSIEDKSLEELKVRLFEIPWPVVLWSFMGSIAAMIYRFNKNPIHAFSDAVKWMITRPIQGVVLGSTFYLVLVSGLFLLTGMNPTESSDSVRVNETILVLAFLVGFSDKFADSVFNTLVERYSGSAKKNKEDLDASASQKELL